MKSFKRHITESEYIPMTIGDKSYKVYTTNDEQSFQRGMMFRESLEHDRGMIFVFETEDTHGMWMKNTRIPLDVIWINEDGRVVDVQTLQPFDTRGAYPAEKAKYVIELNAGEFRGAIGDMILEKKQTLTIFLKILRLKFMKCLMILIHLWAITNYNTSLFLNKYPIFK